MKYVFKIVLLLTMVSAGAFAQRPAETIPSFTLFKPDKTPFKNNNLQPGKMVFFVFFDTECDHCQHAIQYINQHRAEIKKASVYLITLDSQDKVIRFMSKYGSKLPGNKNVTILQDLNNEFLQKFRPRKYPSLFLYSARHTLLMYDDNEQNLFKFIQQVK